MELTAELVRQKLGMDVPIHIQYGRWVGILPKPNGEGFSGILQGNLGKSLWTDRAITEELRNRLPISLELGIIAITTGLIIALPIGIYSAVRQDTLTDYIGRSMAIIFISVPGFWLATMIVVYPSIWWNWMPPVEYALFWENPVNNLIQFLMPAFIMGMVASGAEMRMIRTMMLEVLRQDYIRTAWSKGLTERTVIMRHALKNALIPVVTVVGLRIPIVISGSIVMETIFSLPGIGRLEIEALNKRDYPVISGMNLVVGAFVLVVNLFVDLTYAWLDPRVQYK